jgi:hypothetical protein
LGTQEVNVAVSESGRSERRHNQTAR